MKVNPDGAGLDADRLERITQHFDRRYIVPGKIAGCQVGVARRGQIGYFRSFGSRDLERSRPVTEDTIFRIYSMTKPITGDSAPHAVRARRVPAERSRPPVHPRMEGPQGPREVRGRLVTPGRAATPMSIRDLLMHMWGLSFAGRGLPLVQTDDEGRAWCFRWEPGATLETLVERLVRPCAAFPSGYAVVLFDIDGDLRPSGRDHLGAAVRRVQRAVFGPVGMVDTGFMVPDTKIDRFAANYTRTNKKLVLIDDPERSGFRKLPFLSGGGGLVLDHHGLLCGSREMLVQRRRDRRCGSSDARRWS